MSTKAKAFHEILQPTSELDFIAHYIVDNGSVIPKHFHDGLEIIYIISGEAIMFAGNKAMTAGPGEMLLINPRIVHQSSAPYGNTNIMMQFPSQLLSRLIENADNIELLIPQKLEDMTYGQKESYARIQTAMDEIKGVFQNPKPNKNLMLSIYAFKVINELFASFGIYRKANVFRKQSIEKLGPVLDYIQDNYTKALSVDEVAAVVSLQPEYFCRFFKKCTGSTFLEHLNGLRISYIYSDIINTKEPLAQILEKHGFSNYKVFSRMFKERFNATPRQIRSQSRKNTETAEEYLKNYNLKRLISYEGQWPGILPMEGIEEQA